MYYNKLEKNNIRRVYLQNDELYYRSARVQLSDKVWTTRLISIVSQPIEVVVVVTVEIVVVAKLSSS